MVEGSGKGTVVFRIKKERGQGGSWFIIFFGSLTVATMLYIFIFIRPDLGTSLLLGIVLVFVGLRTVLDVSIKYIEDEIILYEDRSELFINGKFRRAVPFGPDTEVDVILHTGVKDEEFGPLSGLAIVKGETGMSTRHSIGWNLGDIRSMLEPLLELTERHSMKRSDDLVTYLERKERRDYRKYY